MPSTACGLDVLPNLQLLVDALRGRLPPHGPGLSFHIGDSPFALHAAIRLGSTRNHHHSVRHVTKRARE